MEVNINEVRDWVQRLNAVPVSALEKIYEHDGSINEITTPVRGHFVCLFDGGAGEVLDYDAETDEYSVRLEENGEVVSLDENEFYINYDEVFPMWSTMWYMGNPCDDAWFTDEHIRQMSEMGFRVYYSDDFGYIFGINGAGYDFYEAHWVPLYKAWFNC